MNNFVIKADTHCDSILTVEKLNTSLNVINKERQIDFPRLRLNNINLQFFALFIESKYKPHLALNRTLELIDIMNEQIKNEKKLIVVKSKNDLDKIVENKNSLGVLISIEGGDCIDSVCILKILYELGVRSICLTWNNRNQIADGVGEFNANGGLTRFGINVIKEMNNLGMLIDISHICEKSFWDTIKISNQPIIASHSNCFSLCKHPRNLKDEQIKALAKNNGLICITFESEFLGENDIKGVIKHIKYACNLVGTDYVGIGSDFDGMNNVSKGLENVDMWNNIEVLLDKEGFSKKDIEKIMGENVKKILYNVLK